MSKAAKAAKSKKNNVVQLRSPDFDLVYRRAHASWVAITKMVEILSGKRARANKAWKKLLAEAKKLYMDDAALGEHATGRAHEAKARDALKFMAEVDDLGDKIAGLKAAAAECCTAAERSQNQGDLFATGTTVQVAGMGWATQITQRTVYGSLLALHEAGLALDAYQVDLLNDLGGSGLDGVDLGSAAAEAVEAEDGEEAEEPESSDEGDEDDVGF